MMTWCDWNPGLVYLNLSLVSTNWSILDGRSSWSDWIYRMEKGVGTPPPPNTQTHTNFLWSLKSPTYTYTSEKSTKRVQENITEYKVPIMKKWTNFWIDSLGERHPVCDFKKYKSMDLPKFLYKWYLWKLDQTFVHLLKVNP